MIIPSDGPKPIPTRYAGYDFRSRAEARWAVFMSTLEVEWDYEQQGYSAGNRGYLPDFYLPHHDLYLEVKPTDADMVDPEGVERWGLFAGDLVTNAAHGRTAMLIGPIPDPATVDEAGPPRAERWYDPGIVITGDWHYAWCACPTGRHFDIQYEARGGRIFCGCPRQIHDRYQTGNHYRVLEAYGLARAARFEHGDTPGGRWPDRRAS